MAPIFPSVVLREWQARLLSNGRGLVLRVAHTSDGSSCAVYLQHQNEASRIEDAIYMSRYDNTSQDIAGMDFSTCQVIAGMVYMSQDIAGMAHMIQAIAFMELCDEART